MIEAVPEIWDFTRNGVIAAFIVFLRVGAMMAVLPAFGERSVPNRVRLVLALSFSAVVFPAVSVDLMPRAQSVSFAWMALGSEVIAGLAIGMLVRIFVIILEMAGTIIAQSISLSQMFGAGASEPQPVVGHLLLVAGLALAVMLDLHVKIAEVIILSYEAMPAGVFADAASMSEWGLANVKAAFLSAFSLSAPFVIVSLIYNMALGVINRAMPSLMVAMVGAPAITLGGMALMWVCLPLLLELWHQGFDQLLLDPFGVR